MLTLKQLLWLASALCCGNLLAIQVHSWAWEIRQHRLKVMCVVGYLGLVIVIFVLAVWWREAEIQSFFRDAWDEVDVRLRSQQRRLISYIATALLWGTTFLGFLHSRQIPSRWWDASISLFGEILLAFMAGCILLLGWLMIFSPPQFNLQEQNQWVIWFACSYGISLLCLALFRPFLLKIYAQFLQMWRDWFRLK